MKGKKGGWMFNAMFILVILIVLGAAFAAVYVKTNISNKFGDLPKSILESYHNGEKILFYVDYSAKNSIYQASYDLGQKGGFYKISYPDDLGRIKRSFYETDYLDYSLWQEGFFPNKNSLKNNFGSYLNIHLNNYLLQYPKEDVTIPLDNYDFLIKDDKIVGIAIENIEFDVKEYGYT